MFNRKKNRKLNTEADDIRTDNIAVDEEQINRILDEEGSDADVAKVMSLYMPQRKARRLGATLMRLGALRLTLLALIGVIGILFILSFVQEGMGNFTVNIDKTDLYRKGISLCEQGDFKDPRPKLEAESLEEVNNITETDIPKTVDNINGSHNGDDFIAYTYYVRNAGKQNVGYTAKINMLQSAKGAEEAIRIAVYRNGEKVVYAAPGRDGKAEKGTQPFYNSDTPYLNRVDDFNVGYVDKYTIVIWLEGEDPQCVDEIIGGSVQFEMELIADDDEESKVSKLIDDIKSFVSNDDGRGMGADDSKYGDNIKEVTWETRLNK